MPQKNWTTLHLSIYAAGLENSDFYFRGGRGEFRIVGRGPCVTSGAFCICGPREFQNWYIVKLLMRVDAGEGDGKPE